MSDDVVMPIASAENVRGPLGVWRKAYKPRKVKDPSEEPMFQRIADRVSYGMGTPLNIFIWIVLVVGWTLLFALSSSKNIQGGKFLPVWFTSTGYNFPLNLVTTVAELYIGFLVGASSAHLSFEGLTKLARRRALGASIALVAIGGLLGFGASSATASTVPRHPAARLHGEVNVTIWSIDSDGPDFQAIVSGAIGDYGPAVTVLPNGKVDPEHTSEMELDLRRGTFRLFIDGIASKFRARRPTSRSTR